MALLFEPTHEVADCDDEAEEVPADAKWEKCRVMHWGRMFCDVELAADMSAYHHVPRQFIRALPSMLEPRALRSSKKKKRTRSAVADLEKKASPDKKPRTEDNEEQPATEEVAADTEEQPAAEEVAADTEEQPAAEEVAADTEEQPAAEEVAADTEEKPVETISRVGDGDVPENPFLNLPALGSIGRDTAQKTYKDGDIVHTNMTYEDETESNDLSFYQHPIFQILLVVLVVQAILYKCGCFGSNATSPPPPLSFVMDFYAFVESKVSSVYAGA